MDNNYPLQVEISGWLPWQGWCVYGQGGIFPRSPLYTFTSRKSYSILFFLGICFGCAQPCVESIVAHVLGWGAYALTPGLIYARDHYWTRACNIGGHEHPNETSQLLTDAQIAPEEEKQIAARPLRYCCRLPTRVVVAKVVAFVVLTAGIAWQIAGAFVSQIPTKIAALSGSRNCGVWGLKDDALPAAQDEDTLIQGQKETRAAQYARNCYGPESATSLDQFLVFSETNIPLLSMNERQQCPFENETYCVGDGFTAMRFTTGLTDTKYIGLNKRNLPMFNRTTVCVPLNIHRDPGFVEKTSDLPGHWGYKLGPVSSDVYKSNYTFLQYGDPFTFDVRPYTMSTYVHVYSKSARQNYWMPIPELNIRSALNFKSAPYSLTGSKSVGNRVDAALLTKTNQTIKHPMPSPGSPSTSRPPFIPLSSAGRLGLTRRIESKVIHQCHSTNTLLSGSWSQNLFSASLSHAQYDAMDIAIGAGSHKHTYDQKMPAWAQENRSEN